MPSRNLCHGDDSQLALDLESDQPHRDREGRPSPSRREAAATWMMTRWPRRAPAEDLAPRPAMRQARPLRQSGALVVCVHAAPPSVNNGTRNRADYIAAIVHSAPPLSPSQKHLLTEVFHPRSVA